MNQISIRFLLVYTAQRPCSEDWVSYKLNRFFVSGAGQYVQRSDITIDQNAYYTTQEIYSNQVYMPNANNISLSSGYQGKHFYGVAMISQATTLGGFDIRKNDMPFPSNRMNATTTRRHV